MIFEGLHRPVSRCQLFWMTRCLRGVPKEESLMSSKVYGLPVRIEFRIMIVKQCRFLKDGARMPSWAFLTSRRAALSHFQV